jgi:hypothetical protein
MIIYFTILNINIYFISIKYMTYLITDYTKQQAKKNNLIIKPSNKPNKNLDALDSSGKLNSIGDFTIQGLSYIYKNKR